MKWAADKAQSQSAGEGSSSGGVLGRQAAIAPPPKPVTVQQAEQLKQYLNNQWTHRTARLIGNLKDAIDDDVTSAGGADIYAKARSLRKFRADVFDDPEGVAKLMDASGPQKMNRAVDPQDVMRTVASMKSLQFNHLIDTLEKAPPQFKPQAQEALNEIRAHLASQVAKAGQSTEGMWNHKAVTTYLNNNNARLSRVFKPEEMAQFKTLNDAGNILRINRAYPGAAAQKENLLQAGVIKAGKYAAHAVTGGSALHVNPLGVAAGVGIGKAVDVADAKLGARSVEKRIQKLK